MKNWYKPGPVRVSHIEPDPRPQNETGRQIAMLWITRRKT